MKLYLILAILACISSLSSGSDRHTIMGTLQKETGFLKYKGTHGGVEVVVLSNDIGSAWHKEDLAVYFRDLKKTRRFHRQLVFPVHPTTFQEFRCKAKNDKLIIEIRHNKDSDFQQLCSLVLPTKKQ